MLGENITINNALDPMHLFLRCGICDKSFESRLWDRNNIDSRGRVICKDCKTLKDTIRESLGLEIQPKSSQPSIIGEMNPNQ